MGFEAGGVVFKHKREFEVDGVKLSTFYQKAQGVWSLRWAREDGKLFLHAGMISAPKDLSPEDVEFHGLDGYVRQCVADLVSEVKSRQQAPHGLDHLGRPIKVWGGVNGENLG